MYFILIIGLAAGDSPLVVPSGRSETTVMTQAPADPGDMIVCWRKVTAETGSRLRGRTKTCMRAAEWAELDRAVDGFKQGLIDRPPSTAEAASLEPSQGGIAGGTADAPPPPVEGEWDIGFPR